jgi:hypothetical protein
VLILYKGAWLVMLWLTVIYIKFTSQSVNNFSLVYPASKKEMMNLIYAFTVCNDGAIVDKR